MFRVLDGAGSHGIPVLLCCQLCTQPDELSEVVADCPPSVRDEPQDLAVLPEEVEAYSV